MINAFLWGRYHALIWGPAAEFMWRFGGSTQRTSFKFKLAVGQDLNPRLSG